MLATALRNHAGFEARLQDEPFDSTQLLAWRQGWQEADWRLTRLGGHGGKVHFKAVSVAALILGDGQYAATCVEANRPHVVLSQREHVGGCQGGMSAEVVL